MLLWMSHFFPARTLGRDAPSALAGTLDGMWIDPPGYFCREPSCRT